MRTWAAATACAVACGVTGLCWLRRRYVVVRVSGQSMVPSYRAGDRVLVRRTGGRLPARAEVAVLRLPPPSARRPDGPDGLPGLGEARWALKRVAAVPGDPVPDSVRRAVGGVPVVPDERLVLLGDNSRSSSDSRAWGFIPAADLLGRVVSRIP